MPGIDISQLAPLDETFAPPPPPQAFAPPGQPPGYAQPHYGQQQLAPPPQAFAPPQPHKPFAPPTGAFRPPAEDDAPIGVERSTRAIRIANQQDIEQVERELGVKPRASNPQIRASNHHIHDPNPPAPRRSIIGLIAAVLLIAIVALVVVVLVTKPGR